MNQIYLNVSSSIASNPWVALLLLPMALIPIEVLATIYIFFKLPKDIVNRFGTHLENRYHIGAAQHVTQRGLRSSYVAFLVAMPRFFERFVPTLKNQDIRAGLSRLTIVMCWIHTLIHIYIFAWVFWGFVYLALPKWLGAFWGFLTLDIPKWLGK